MWLYLQLIGTFERLQIFVIYLHICNIGEIEVLSIYIEFW